DPGVTLSQFPPLVVDALAVNANVPPPEFATVIPCRSGVDSAPNEKVRFVSSTLSLGEIPAPTTNVTATVRDAGEAFGTLIVMIAVLVPCGSADGSAIT